MFFQTAPRRTGPVRSSSCDHPGGRHQALPQRPRGGGRPQPRGRRGRGVRAGRALGLRQDDDAADDQPADRPHQRAHRRGRPGHHGHRPGRAPAPRRLRDPARRAVPPPDRGRQHRHGPQAAPLGQGPHPRPGPGADAAGRPRPHDLPRPLPVAALGRPAAARRRGSRPGGRSARAADGRALRRHRPGHPGAPAAGVPRAPASVAQDRGARHPRHRRSGAARRSHRAAGPRRRAGPARHAGRPAHAPGRRLRRRLRRSRPGPEAPGRDEDRRVLAGAGRDQRRQCRPSPRGSDGHACGRRWPRPCCRSRASSWSSTRAASRSAGWASTGWWRRRGPRASERCCWPTSSPPRRRSPPPAPGR